LAFSGFHGRSDHPRPYRVGAGCERKACCDGSKYPSSPLKKQVSISNGNDHHLRAFTDEGSFFSLDLAVAVGKWKKSITEVNR
jgi:hypothetical protein